MEMKNKNDINVRVHCRDAINRVSTMNQTNTPTLRFSEFNEEWEKKKLGEVLTIGSGRDYKHLGVGEIPVFGTGGLMTKVDDYLYDGETVCIGRKGTIDKPMYFNGKLWTVDTLFYTHTFIDSTPKFVYNLFQRVNWKQHNEAGGVPSLSKSTIEQIDLVFPTLPEQTKIAEFFTAIDAKIQALKTKKETLQQYKKGVMQGLFSDRKDKACLVFTDDDGKPFPKWEMKKLGEVAEFSKGKGISKADIIENGRTECIRYGELYTVYGETINKVISRTNIEDKNLVLSEANDVIIPASGETQIDIATASCVVRKGIALGGDLNIIKTRNNGVFLSYYLNSSKKQEIANLAQGISVVHLYSSQLSTLSISIPSLPEQTKIAHFLSSLDEKINHTETQIQETQAWKKGLLQRMFV